MIADFVVHPGIVPVVFKLIPKGIVLIDPQSRPPLPVFSSRRFVFGGEQSDMLTGDTQADRLYGSGGNDYLEGRGGNDYLEGGAGVDVYQYSASEAGINSNEGAATLRGFATGKLSLAQSAAPGFRMSKVFKRYRDCMTPRAFAKRG